MKHLIAIQQELKAPKGRFNSFGKYNYRSCEDILEAVKPLCHKNGCVLTLSDKPIQVGDRYYIEATATLKTPDGEIKVTASARESEEKKGMDESQITGTASSYARKYALNGLFNIDDTKDADTDEYQNEMQRGKDKAAKRTTSSTAQKPPKASDKAMTKADFVEIVTDLCDKKRFRVAELCERTGVDSLEDMTEDQLSKWVDWLEKK